LELLLRVNQREYLPGDMFQLTSVFRNPGTAVMSQHYIVLDVEEQYWFWPSWSEEVDSRPWTIPGPGNWSYTYLDFIWPAGAGSANGIRFWGALLSPTSSELLCGLAMCEFGFSE